MPDSRPRYGVTKEGLLLDCEKLLVWDPAAGVWIKRPGIYTVSYLNSSYSANEAVAGIMPALDAQGAKQAAG